VSPPPLTRPPIEVAAGLVFRAGRLLLAQRRPGDHLGGLWEFPGGKRRAHESYPECLRRELEEELGIEVEVLELVEALTHTYPEKTVHLRFHRCRWLRHEPRALGCHAWAWATRPELGRYPFPPADERLLERLAREATWWDRD
jgi:mutator protein MutT